MPVCPPVRASPLMVTLSASSTVNTDALVEEAATPTHGPVRTPITQLWLPLRVNGEVIAGRAEPRVTVSVASPLKIAPSKPIKSCSPAEAFASSIADRSVQSAGVAVTHAPPDASPLLSTT